MGAQRRRATWYLALMPKQVTNASRRKRGLRRLEVWLDADTITALDEICERSGYSRRDVIKGYIDAEREEWTEVDRRGRRVAL
jgi:hypothetical protein